MVYDDRVYSLHGFKFLIMEITVGMVFHRLDGKKCTVSNVFKFRGKEVITYRYWLKRKQIWVFESDFKHLFLIAFDYGWKWDLTKKQTK